MSVYHRFISFQRLEIFHIALRYLIGNRSCPHGLVELLILQFPDSHSMKQIEKREENGTSFLFIKSTLLRYKYHEIKYSYLKFLGWLTLAYVYVCINTIIIKILNTPIIFKTNTIWILLV